MTTVELRLLANRYHGTAWGRHVNEGVPEWPPSPYRLVRALYDAWKRKRPHLAESAVLEVLRALADTPPSFRLPKAAASHTRSYLSSNTTDPSDKRLIFDAFVAIPKNNRCFIEWPAELTEGQKRTLTELLEALNYLGRSESWVEARLTDGCTGGLLDFDPVDRAEAGGDLMSVACPVPEPEYRGPGKWLDALTYSTTEMLKEKRTAPPAMQNVNYLAPRNAVVTWISSRRPAGGKEVTGVVLALSGKVLPLGTEAIWVAERIREALMALWSRYNPDKPVPPVLHGKDDLGRPEKEHRHLFILPQIERFGRNAGRITRVLLHSAEGLNTGVLQTILRLRRLHWSEEPVWCAVSWRGNREDRAFRRRTKVVESTTPFVTSRHWRRGRGTLEQFLAAEVRRECRNHRLPEPVSVQAIGKPAGRWQCIQFRRSRRGEPPLPGYAFRVVFPEEVPVPFSLGSACHFGLGQFDRV